MACEQQSEFFDIVKRHLPGFFAGERVLEMGSLDVNGSARKHFITDKYVGVDVGGGPGVDVVSHGQLFNGWSGSFDVAVSANCFEHNPYWLETFINMLRLTKENGLVLFTCASTGFRRHGTAEFAPDASPLTVKLGWDYYRNLTERDFTSRLDLRLWLSDWRFFRDHDTYCLYFVGFRDDGRRRRRLPPRLVDEVRAAYSPWRSARALKRYVKVKIFGDFWSSPLSHYVRKPWRQLWP